jgi:outer membrane protein, heavy metal efflux system
MHALDQLCKTAVCRYLCPKWDNVARGTVPNGRFISTKCLVSGLIRVGTRRAIAGFVRFSVFLFFLAQLTAAACNQAPMISAGPPETVVSQTERSLDDSSGASTSPITLSEAVALAVENSPVLKEAAASLKRSEAGIQTAKTYTNPTVEFLGGPQSARRIRTPGVPGTIFHYSASQTIENPAARRTRIRSSQLDRDGNRFQLLAVQLSVRADLKRAFYDVIRRKEQLAFARDNLGLVQDLQRRVQMEVQVSEKGKLELTRAEAELARARSAVRSADIQLANTQAVLKALLGSTSDKTFDPQGTLGNAIQIGPLNEIRPQVLNNHPVLAQANAQTARAQSLIENERARRIPEPTLYGEFERQPDITLYRFGVNLSVPLWDRRKGPIGEAQAELERSQAFARQQRLEITAALERAYDQYQISNQQVDGLESGSLREAEAAVEAARAAYKSPPTNFFFAK